MIGKTLGNRYTIMEEISGGGMAIVYKALCNLLNRIVAIKILKSEFSSDEDFVRRFRREAQAAASLSHPNIVGIYDVGEEEGLHYIVMEYVEGHTLKEIIKQRFPMPLIDVIEIGIQICDALECAHKNKIVHRDIKSQNIMMTSDGRVKVTDFGIARATGGTTITNTGNSFGSVQYFSPEQAKGDVVDERSDIYSLGVVLYEAFSGKLPFDGQAPVSVALKHIQEKQEPISHIIPGFPKSLEEIVEKCLFKSPNERYQSAEELRTDLIDLANTPEIVHFEPLDFEQTMMIDEISDSLRSTNPPKKVKKKRNVFRGMSIALSLIIMFVAFSYLGGVLAKRYLEVPEKLLPDVVGLSEAQAKSELEKEGFKADAEVVRVNDPAPAGEVIDQDPKGNQKIKINHPPIKLTVSKGQKPAIVPSIIGENEQKGKMMLSNSGFVPGRPTREHNKDVPEGVIIDQNPRAHLSLAEGTTVNFVVSLGPDLVSVPQLIGETLNKAKEILDNKDIPYTVSKKASDVSENTVIEQSPNSGELLEPGSKVNLVVSSGPAKADSKKIGPLHLPSEPEEFTIKVFVSDDLGKKRLVYSEEHTPEDSPLSISVEGVGTMDVEVFLDDVLLYKNEH